jgi:predicted methyltransferase
VPVMFAPCATQLLDLAGVEPGERVLDVACGTGIVARRAAARVGAEARFRSPGEYLRRQAASSPLGAPLAALDEEPRRALARELDQTLGEWADDDGLVFPMQTWLATARR